MQWIEGPTRSATHVMGAFSDGDKVYVDVEMSMSNPPIRTDARRLAVESDRGHKPHHTAHGFSTQST